MSTNAKSVIWPGLNHLITRATWKPNIRSTNPLNAIYVIKNTRFTAFSTNTRSESTNAPNSDLSSPCKPNLNLTILYFRSHLQIKPYHCEICDKKFAQITPFKVHKRRHLGERPYKCKICDRDFVDTVSYKAHIRVHAGSEPFQCTICPRRFNHAGSFKNHMR